MLEAHLGHFAVANQLLTDAEAASSASDDTLGTATTYLLRAEVQLGPRPQGRSVGRSCVTRANRRRAPASL